MKKAIFIILAVALISFCACSPYADGGYEFDPGETLSGEELESLFQDSEADATEFVIDESTAVYWAEGGSKYHLFADCGHLSNSADVKMGKISNAKEKGKSECCKTCAGRAGIEE